MSPVPERPAEAGPSPPEPQSPPGEERELKFALGAEPLDAVRRRLEAQGAHAVRPAARECNWVFDRRDELYGSGRLLRLRSDGQGSRVTFKGPPRFEGGVKIREEIEVAVGHAEQMRDLLVRLGYRVMRRYEKVREEWRLAGTLVSLDHTPIGDFVEFEGEDAAAVAARCGFEVDAAERRSYLRLYEDWRRDHPEFPPDMVF